MIATAVLALLAAQEPVRVYVLAGQSNMEGKAKVFLAERQVARPRPPAFYAPWRRDGRWLERDDVARGSSTAEARSRSGTAAPAASGPSWSSAGSSATGTRPPSCS